MMKKVNKKVHLYIAKMDFFEIYGSRTSLIIAVPSV